MMKAIGKAMEFDEVDVLNISAGAPHIANDDKSCSVSGAACAVCDVAEQAVEQGITIVAAAGNKPQTPSLCCPSLSSQVLSVGGVVTKCTAHIEPDDPILPLGSPAKPPNAHWIARTDDTGTEQVYCSNLGCSPGTSCSENRVEEVWDKNPPTVNGNPDVLAPITHPTSDKIGPWMDIGTSFATPIVTAGIVNAIDGLQMMDITPTSFEIKTAMKNSCRDIGDRHGVFSHDKLVEQLGEIYGLDYESG
jgi:hypothetical protein